MSSTYAALPSSLVNNRGSVRTHESRNFLPAAGNPHQMQASTPVNSNHLSPYTSSHGRCDSASPTLNIDTPADSVSASSVHYQSSDFSEVCDDPFFGVDFNTAECNSPSFLGPFAPPDQDEQPASTLSYSTPEQAHGIQKVGSYHPISPDHTPFLYNNRSTDSERKGAAVAYLAQLPQSVSPQELTKQFQPLAVSGDLSQFTYQLTPETSDDGVAPAPPAMSCQSPRVTVSIWGNDNDEPEPTVTAAGDPAALPSSVTAGHVDCQPGDSEAATAGSPPARDNEGRWPPNETAGHHGLDPDNRPSTDVVSSVNDLAAQRKVEGKNQEVRDWLTDSLHSLNPSPPVEETVPGMADSGEQDDNVSPREIPLGSETENKLVPGQTYFPESGGAELTAEDINIMRENRNWADGPVLHRIQGDGTKYQPETAQAAMERFARLCRDNDSVVSRAATWGTRRRSLPSVLDVEGVTSGSFLKKLSISRGENRRPSIFDGVRGLLKKPSTSFKRARNSEDESSESPVELKESRDSLAPPPTLSGGFKKKQSVPSMNTALVSVTHSAAAVGTTHVRSGSISTGAITSPKSPNALSLGVKAMMRRPRSGSELADMWKKAGGPPVANLAKPATTADQDEDDDDDDDIYEEADMAHETDKMIDDINPTLAGFREHVLKLSPGLANTNTYLVDRITHQQLVRYKSLLSARVRHLNFLSTGSCPCGSMCIAQGGSANSLDSKGDGRLPDPLSARYDGSDENMTPREGALSPESFPQDIPMPPTSSLPSEFECQLCFQAKKFQKPSDWTKHVHEDVQPFTCTWDRCKDPKIFKRKADWVRHENEGHRHLEWWTCDVDDCRHVCYRRDNFLQHLVREHKFAEPKVKTKAALKRAAAVDPTWQMVEKCHHETPKRPQDEPCRFCGRTFPTWKKLTVHLAKHMEQMSLPILRLVARKELDMDTIISPVQDPPPRSFPAEREPVVFNQPSTMSHAPTPSCPPSTIPYHNPQHQAYAFNNQFGQPPFYNHNQFESLGHSLESTSLGMQVNHGFSSTGVHGYNNMPVTADTCIPPQDPYSSVGPLVEPFPALSMNALGLPGLQGLPDTPGNQVPYGNLIDHSGVGVGAEQYASRGTVSPFTPSPNQRQGGFYGHGQ